MIEIAGRKIGPNQPPYFIADVGANHDGSLARAIHLIELAAEAGTDAVKFQNFRAHTIVSRRGFEELGQIGHQSDWPEGVYETYEAASMPLAWIPELAQTCEAYGVVFMTTPYDLALVDEIDPYVPAWKIGSGDITWHELIRHVASKGKPVFLATGASTAEEVDAAVGAYLDAVPRHRVTENLVLMQCNTNYTRDEENFRYLNLRVLRYWAEDHSTHFGLSDHTSGHLAACAAVALGARVVEKHFTDDSRREGPDHAFAMEPDQWRDMVEAACDVWSARGDGVKKVEENEKEARIVQRRALRWAYDLTEGRIGGAADWPGIVATRPCPEGALEPYRINEVLGRVLKRSVKADTLVRPEDFE